MTASALMVFPQTFFFCTKEMQDGFSAEPTAPNLLHRQYRKPSIVHKEIPSSSAPEDSLKRMSEKGGIEGMEKINDDITKKVLKKDDRRGYTLIIGHHN